MAVTEPLPRHLQITNRASRISSELFKTRWIEIVRQSSRERWTIERQGAALEAIDTDALDAQALVMAKKEIREASMSK